MLLPRDLTGRESVMIIMFPHPRTRKRTGNAARRRDVVLEYDAEQDDAATQTVKMETRAAVAQRSATPPWAFAFLQSPRAFVDTQRVSRPAPQSR